LPPLAGRVTETVPHYLARPMAAAVS